MRTRVSGECCGEREVDLNPNTEKHTHTRTLTECYLSVQFIFLLKIVLKYST